MLVPAAGNQQAGAAARVERVVAAAAQEHGVAAAGADHVFSAAAANNVGDAVAGEHVVIVAPHQFFDRALDRQRLAPGGDFLRLAAAQGQVHRDAGRVAGEVQGIEAAAVADDDVGRTGGERVVVVAGAADELDRAHAAVTRIQCRRQAGQCSSD